MKGDELTEKDTARLNELQAAHDDAIKRAVAAEKKLRDQIAEAAIESSNKAGRRAGKSKTKELANIRDLAAKVGDLLAKGC